MNFKTLSFKNAHGEMLSGRLDLPLGAVPDAYAIFAHCFTCSKHTKAVAAVSHALSRKGIAVLRFDFTGLGDSEGDFSDTTFSSNVADLISAAGYLNAHYAAPKILIGHSFGGTACLKAAGHLPGVKAVATIGSPFDPAHVQHLLGDAREAIEKSGEASVTLAGRPFRIKRQFLEDLDTAEMIEVLPKLNRALLVLHSPVDEVVGINNAAQIYKTARHPKSFISLDTADHMLGQPADAEYAGSVIAEWAARYIDARERTSNRPPAGEHHVVTRIGRSRYRTEITAGGHRLVADEPADVGGTDTGPAPYDLLTAGLGACTAITLRMYADRKAWPLEAVTVSLVHRKVDAAACRDCETRTGTIDRIERIIDMTGPLETDQRQRLMEIAGRCPVHRTLHGEIDVVTTEKSPAGDKDT
ncbi:alpha/beta fold hydrolase [Desulfosarcina sp.]|uniref:bifunctional alpha/beta hydrolase/OsmC family protein n=1 Tax=Desulfosarcina sp. TaxID=2027861 RepID=UPI003564F037